MTAWTNDELDKIGVTREIEIAPLRRDGALRKPVTIWVVRLNDNLYVRSWRGRGGSWFRGAQRRHEGRIWGGDMEKDVVFTDASDAQLNDLIDAAYRTKYGSSPYVGAMVAQGSRATTLRLTPRGGA